MATAEDFADVVPTPLDEGDRPPAAIAFPQHYSLLMGIFRTLHAAGEVSSRALALTERAIALNPANYSAWAYRRRCLQALVAGRVAAGDAPGVRSLLEREFAYTDGLSADSPKNYQLWGHRRWLVGFHLRHPQPQPAPMGPPGCCAAAYPSACAEALRRELRFTLGVLAAGGAAWEAGAGGAPQPAAGEPDWVGPADDAVGTLPSSPSEEGGLLPVGFWCAAAGSEGAGGTCAPDAVDPKNYHAWAHRQWALAVLGPRSLPAPAAGGACACWQPLPATPPPLAPEAWPRSLLAHELAVTRCLLSDDVRNNSAWNHRWGALRRSGALRAAAVLAGEVDVAARALWRGGPSQNDSAWGYLAGLTAAWLRDQQAAGGLVTLARVHAAFPSLLPGLARLREDAEPGVHVRANEALAALLEAAAGEGAAGGDACGLPASLAAALAGVTPASLRRDNADADPPREAYWLAAAAASRW